MDRRTFVTAALASTAMPSLAIAAAEGNFEVTRTDAEWRAMLTDLQYRVMRLEATERAGSSPLDKKYSDGVYHCRGCDLALYNSDTKYDSKTGWPSFFRARRNAIRTMEDRKLFSVRTECHCRRCGSHLGHIFSDGPAPTGQRHCLNGVSLVFRAA